MYYKTYCGMLKNDEDNEKDNAILNRAIEKVKNVMPASLSDEEVFALIEALDGFEYWPVDVDYWDMDSWDEVIDALQRADVSIEYAGSKLCDLIDSSAPKEELETWFWVNYSYRRYRFYLPPMETDAVDKKLLAWGNSHTDTPKAFADSLSSEEIQTLLDSALFFDKCDLPMTEKNSDFSRYQIVGQYIKSLLCNMIEQGCNLDDINDWYRLNLAFNYA